MHETGWSDQMARVRGTQKALAKLSQLEKWIVRDAERYRGQWREEYFHRNAPLHLELGSGRGGFLLSLAQRETDTLFIGMERLAPVLVAAAQKAEGAGVENAVFLHEDVVRLPQLFAEGEVDCIYINFVDPWPKKRHAKRRLTHTNYLRLYKQVLRRGGSIFLKTDHEGLFEFSLNEFADNRFRLRGITLDLHRSPWAETNVMTEYEQRFHAQGKKIYRCEAIWEGD
jgi:tRNA (guanine-N7-)-methyltransferase